MVMLSMVSYEIPAIKGMLEWTRESSGEENPNAPHVDPFELFCFKVLTSLFRSQSLGFDNQMYTIVFNHDSMNQKVLSILNPCYVDNIKYICISFHFQTRY